MSYKRISPMPVVEGGTGAQTLTAHGILLGEGTSAIVSTTAGTNGQIIVGSTGADPAFITPTAGSGLSVTTNATTLSYAINAPVSIANGGTNATTMATADGTVIFDGTRLVTTATGTAGQLLTSNGAGVAPTYQAAPASSISITGNSGGALTGNAFTFTGGTTGLTFSGAGTTETLTGTLVVANGGTGNTTFTAYSVICAGTTATGVFQNVSGVGTSGQLLTSNGAAALPTWQAPAASSISITGNSGGALTGNAFTFTGGTTGLTFSGSGTTETLTGTLVVANGGTGNTTFTAYSVICAGTTATGIFQNVSGVGTSGQVLTSNGASALPTWQATAASSISITGDSGGALSGAAFTFTGGTTGLTFSGSGSTETLTGTLVVANGGTGKATFTAYSVICAGTTATGIFQNVSGVGTSGQVLTSNGASALPTWQAAAGGITTLSGDSGSATGSTVSIKAYAGGDNSGTTVNFSASVSAVQLNVTDANDNTTIGKNSGKFGMSGTFNCILGQGAGAALTSGASNCVLGSGSVSALAQLTTGGFNICIGDGAGYLYTTSESSNIQIGARVNGTTGESNVLRIGSGTGTGTNGNLNSAFICGINGITVTGTAVLVSSSNQLGVAVSSRKFKDHIQDMGDMSSDLMKLRPVSFVYTVGDDTSIQTGLIAEEVNEVMPSLVVYDKYGDPQTVKYHDLPALLLNELQKLNKRVEFLEAALAERN